MKKILLLIILLGYVTIAPGQNVMTPELLWNLKRIGVVGMTSEGNAVIFGVTQYDIPSDSRSTNYYTLPVSGGQATPVDSYADMYSDPHISPDGKFQLFVKEVKLGKVFGKDFFPELDKSNVRIYDDLNYRHWDEWEDGKYQHLFLRNLETGEEKDLMEGEKYDCPQKPFGGSDDYTWSEDGEHVLYVSKKEYGTAYAVSTNTDIYSYELATGETTNLTSDNKGYDTSPQFSQDGVLAWLQMDEPGYESDKNDLMILKDGMPVNLTAHWDGTVNGFAWDEKGKKIYFTAPLAGTIQLFEVEIPKKGEAKISQVTEGIFDVTSIVGQHDETLIVTRTDMNHAAELFTVNLKDGSMSQLSHLNDEVYAGISLSRVEKRMVPTTDGKQMVTWVIYPPDFDPSKKYPTLLYCQGGPQSALSQFYSFRWNFQLMAANGYIIVAPNRRGMPGYGVKWNEDISEDWGGQDIRDYLSAIDDVSREAYVDKDRRGCIGASYGGYSVFFLEGHHEGRFKSFIAHDGIFDTESMYNTTEELFFVNKDLGGAPWEDPESKSFNEFNPSNFVDRWDAPILIIQGGLDFRVPPGQGLAAFQAAQLRGLKSRLLYFPEENHWILSPQNGIVWQRNFFGWLEETLL